MLLWEIVREYAEKSAKESQGCLCGLPRHIEIGFLCIMEVNLGKRYYKEFIHGEGEFASLGMSSVPLRAGVRACVPLLKLAQILRDMELGHMD